jgi:uncharacterized repeat protein (TIGR01451 family)
LAWDPLWNNTTDLRFELQNLQVSLSDYTNARNLDDHILHVGDYVASLPGNNGATLDAIRTLVGQELIIPVWDGFQNPISWDRPAAFHISSFARVRIRDDSPYWIDLTSNDPKVWATYLGPVDLVQCPYLTLAKSGPPTAAANSPITYTLTLTNSGNLTATNLVITDAVPANATYLGGGTLAGNVVSWTVPSLAVGSSLTRTFSVTASQTITNNDYRVSSAEEVSATGTVSVVTSIAPNLTIIKSGPTSVPANRPITYTLQVHNNGGLAANLILTDTLPAAATYITGGTLLGNVVSWTVPSLPFGSSLTRTFNVTATQTITNNDYRVSADGGVSAAGLVAVVTHVTVTNSEPARVYLPVILKN